MTHGNNIPEQAAPYQIVAEAAAIYHAAGRSLGPIPPNRKYPEGNSWKKYQTEPPTPADLTHWFDERSPMELFLICRRVSGGLEVIDFDVIPVYHAYVALARELAYEDLWHGW